MDKTAIKNYAVAARRKLMDAVRTKMASLYMFEDMALPPEEANARLRADGIFLTAQQMDARLKLCAYLAQLGNEMDNEKAFSHVLEEVAYTWFNRLIALRYMEVNDYLPSGIRILSSAEAGRAEPDAMREAERLPYVSQNKISEYRADTSPGASEKLYKYILISQCNALHDILPGMFQKIDDYTELLLPDSLYQRGGIVHDLVNAISEDDFKEQVQIIGWLYQYYISEKKDEVFAALKKNVKINKETIPAATQLFTPEWIVKYMVENSLGRLWLTYCPPGMACGNAEDALRELWNYYVDDAEQEPAVEKQLEELEKQYRLENPTQIKIIDPCMGSGHILVYAFDVLYQIYFSQGYAEREIPNLILQNNIYGLDIDGRATQLAYFALMMKARSYNRRFFRPNGEGIPQPHVHAVIESDGAQRYHLDYMGDGMIEADRKECKEGLGYLMELFRDAREYGSILKIEQKLDYDKLRQFVKALRPGQISIDAGDIAHVADVLLDVIEVAESLTRKYDVVVTNPPYMGSGGMGPSLLKYVKKHYDDGRNDLYTVFILKCKDLCCSNGFVAMITQQGWMSLTRSAQLRNRLYSEAIYVNMLHLGSHVFEDLSGEVVKTGAFVLRKCALPDFQATYCKVDKLSNVEEKEKSFLNRQHLYYASLSETSEIEGAPMSYWLPRAMLPLFQSRTIKDNFICRAGMQTGDNEQFLRFWYEPSSVAVDHFSSGTKWFGYNKGGSQRRWFGNTDLVVNWRNNGQDIKRFKKHRLELGEIEKKNSECWNSEFYFVEGATWSSISSGSPMFRYTDNSTIFDIKGPTCFAKPSTSHEELLQILGFLNTPIISQLLDVLSPTLDCNPGTVSGLPYISQTENQHITGLVKKCIAISKSDWDSFETSWDFQMHPFAPLQTTYLMGGKLETTEKLESVPMEALAFAQGDRPTLISKAYKNWEGFTQYQFAKLKSNEEELNRIFIDIYGLQDELTPGVEDKDVTIRKADLGRDIRSFLSYAVGCMFGRYSLDEPGLVFAGGAFDASRYKTYLPEGDNILPIGSADYFDDDIVVRLTEFVRAVYGDSTLDENLNFIADALYPNANGSAKDRIRRYFLNDFYKDHLKIYQKRPIYWMLDSAGSSRGSKKDGFKALFYLHRYDKYTVARARTDYLHPLQRKYEAAINQKELLSGSTESASEKANYRREIEALQAKIDECRTYDQVVAHIAHQQIDLDLDDGVKVNYEKFQGVEVPMDNGKTVKMDLLGKI